MKTDLSAVLLERAFVIMKLKACGLSLGWLKEYSLPCLLASCDRKQESLPGENIMESVLQRELIENRGFAAWLAELLPLFPEEPPAKPEPKPAYSHQVYRPQPVKTSPSHRTTLLSALCGLVEACTAHGKDITSYSQDKVKEMLEENAMTGYTRLVYLENFAFEELSEDMERTIRVNLLCCNSVPLTLTEKEKALLVEPYVATRQLFSLSPFEEVLALLDNHPGLLDIIMLLHEKLIYEGLDLTNYNVFAQDETEYFRLLESLISLAGHDAANRFLGFWKKNGCPLRELRKIEAQVRENPELDWAEHLSTHAGYINQVYGVRFKHIDLASVSKYQEGVLIYAIVKNKKHFIKLVDNQADLFLGLPSTSILFQESLYLDHFNLNELTVKELNDCAWMITQKLSVESLVPDRRYTFPELRALYDTPKQYIRFYHALQSENQDYRLKVLRQVQKRNLLRFNMEDTEITALAARLDEKPLDTWMQTDFSHIVDLTASDTVQVLICLDRLRHLLPSIRTRTEISLALRNLDVLNQCKSISELKENLLQTDSDWLSLIEQMNLTPEFLEKHRNSIIRFLCKDGAHIAVSYLRSLNDNREEAFLRVVKAELMGQLDALKYYDGDLQRELDSPLANQVKLGWKENTSLVQDGLVVREHDDFFSTMLLGTQPQRTCLAYSDGAYKSCLLSAFDSNKKILYATQDGRVVGRAFLRLTKGRLTGSDTTSGFTFVDLENVPATHPEREREGLTLFLERPYIAGAHPLVAANIMRMFIELAERKADELGTMLVLSADYRKKDMPGFTWTQYAIYISKSKAGEQYLDSLGGQATVSKEGSYKPGSFLVRNRRLLQLERAS